MSPSQDCSHSPMGDLQSDFRRPIICKLLLRASPLRVLTHIFSIKSIKIQFHILSDDHYTPFDGHKIFIKHSECSALATPNRQVSRCPERVCYCVFQEKKGFHPPPPIPGNRMERQTKVNSASSL